MRLNFVDFLVIIFKERVFRNSYNCDTNLDYYQNYMELSDEKVVGQWVAQRLVIFIADVILQLKYLENKARNGQKYFPDGRLDINEPICVNLKAIVDQK